MIRIPLTEWFYSSWILSITVYNCHGRSHICFIFSDFYTSVRILYILAPVNDEEYNRNQGHTTCQPDFHSRIFVTCVAVSDARYDSSKIKC